MEALTFISHSLSRTDSLVCKISSVDGLAAAFDTITSIFPYFCKKTSKFQSFNRIN